MPAGPKLSEEERGMALALSALGKSLREIERLVGRSRSAIALFLSTPAAYDKNKRPGRPPKVTPSDVRRILRTASNSFLSSRELVNHCDLSIKARRAHQLLASAQHLENIKVMASPLLTRQHKVERAVWAREKVTWDDQKWVTVVFSDEKKFNLDGPDGLKFYWHDLRKEKTIFSKRQSGGGSVMGWGGFCSKEKTQLAILEGNQDSSAYVDTLPEYLFPFGDVNFGRDCEFQHDNASTHASKETKAFLAEQGLRVMKWPSKSPDLNPIENM
ncbi:hypothetical protein AaE_015816 [Aphanomyces astaci]|uniref:Tc3 transposase DNA binding domain-containing protein n=1 Tax=Aphanomyces astaci TaxID=112090 RepID=A0A6A4YUY1_APHAT|nr:hypothetical protein AaE_015816 [Aphanomyces astaci]